MTDMQIAKAWVQETGAEEVFTGKGEAVKIGLSLLRAWRRYKKNGRCPWTGEELYDYTCFVHAFANKYAPEDDEQYHWLTKHSEKILNRHTQDSCETKNRFCPVCGRILTPANVARGESGEIVVFAQGKAWCETCAAEARLRKLIDGSA